MNKFRIMAALAVFALAVVVAGCTPAQNTNTATAPAATPEPTPDKAAIAAELTKIENDWPRILKERDAAAVRRIEADDAVLVYPDGSLGGKEQDVKDIEAGNISYDEWNVSEINVKVLDADCAVVSLFIDVKKGKYKLPNGQLNDISGRYRSVDTFARRNGQWQLVGSAAVPVKGPAGSASPTPAASASPKSSPAARPSPTRRSPPPPPTNQ